MKAQNDFMALDDTDYKILSMINKRSNEFSKLRFSDQMVLVWFLVYAPKGVKSWIDFLNDDYRKSKEIKIDFPKLYDEIIELYLA